MLVHPQSIVHGLVSFTDGAVIAGMAVPDMQVPISHCLGWPARVPTAVRRLDLASIGTLTFDKPDYDRFPALRVAMAALAAGGAMTAVLNAANEIAVEAFLAGRIGFNDIARSVEEACDDAGREGLAAEPATVADALAIDHIVREKARRRLGAGAPRVAMG